MRPIRLYPLIDLSQEDFANVPAGTAVRFEPGQTRKVELVSYAGDRMVYGFNAKIMGSLD